jgi:hypothetical protein
MPLALFASVIFRKGSCIFAQASLNHHLPTYGFLCSWNHHTQLIS